MAASINLSAEHLRSLQAVALCASTDSGRPILGAVRLEPSDGGAVAVATDSYRLGFITLEGVELSEPVLLSARELSAGIKGIKVPKRSSLEVAATLEVDGGEVGSFRLSSPLTASVYGGPLVAGQYPGWRSLVPASFPDSVDQSAGHVSAFNADYLATLSAIVKALGLDAPSTPVKVSLSDGSRPALFRLGGFSCLLMPVRVS